MKHIIWWRWSDYDGWFPLGADITNCYNRLYRGDMAVAQSWIVGVIDLWDYAEGAD